MFDVILDCYTDEPSGLGAPPYLSVHSRYISGTLLMLGREHFYLTIDDIRISKMPDTLSRIIDFTAASASYSDSQAAYKRPSDTK